MLAGPTPEGWYGMSYRDIAGYVPSRYIERTEPAGTALAWRYDELLVLSLARQQMEVYEGGKLRPYRFVSPWPKGHPYHYKPSRVDYALRFRHDGYYIHNAPWRRYHGQGTSVRHRDLDGVVRTGSHGCVNVPLWEMRRVYGWARPRTVVRIVPY